MAGTASLVPGYARVRGALYMFVQGAIFLGLHLSIFYAMWLQVAVVAELRKLWYLFRACQSQDMA